MVRERRFAGITCGICGKTFKCGPNQPEDACAKKYGMYKIVGINLKEGAERSVYVCPKCYEKHFSKILNPYG